LKIENKGKPNKQLQEVPLFDSFSVHISGSDYIVKFNILFEQGDLASLPKCSSMA